MKKHLNKICVFLVIISILCTALFSGCSKKASVSVNESESNSASVSENNKDTAKSGNHKEDSPAIEENSSVLNKETETEKTTKDKYNKESTTKPVGKETTTEVKAKEPTTAAYTPKPLVPLTAEQERKIKQDYLEFYKEKFQIFDPIENEYYQKLSPEERKELNIPEDYVYKTTAEGILIQEYFGKYNNCLAMFICDCFDVWLCAVTSKTVAGYNFVYGSSQEITVYNNGSFATLTEAYNKGWLSKDDIREMNYHYYEQKSVYKDYAETDYGLVR